MKTLIVTDREFDILQQVIEVNREMEDDMVLDSLPHITNPQQNEIVITKDDIKNYRQETAKRIDYVVELTVLLEKIKFQSNQ